MNFIIVVGSIALWNTVKEYECLKLTTIYAYSPYTTQDHQILC